MFSQKNADSPLAYSIPLAPLSMSYSNQEIRSLAQPDLISPLSAVSDTNSHAFSPCPLHNLWQEIRHKERQAVGLGLLNIVQANILE